MGLVARSQKGGGVFIPHPQSFQGSVYILGPEVVKKHALNLLREVGSGDRLVIELCTETLLSDENLLLLTSVLENADLPLTKEKILANNEGK